MNSLQKKRGGGLLCCTAIVGSHSNPNFSRCLDSRFSEMPLSRDEKHRKVGVRFSLLQVMGLTQ